MRAGGARGDDAVVLRWMRRTTRQVVDHLPKGHSLPDDAWRVRHRTLTYLLTAHVAGVVAFGLTRRQPVVHLLVEAGIVAAFAAVGWAATGPGRRRQVSSAVTAVGLVVSSAVLVHLSDGVIEMHFHFFVMVGILTLYQDWVPFLLAIGFVVVHHGLVGTLAPAQVYNHPAAIAHPFRWALVHGLFVLAASMASIVAWKLNEEQALKDGLTRLANRRLFRDRLGHALARGQRNRGLLAVLYIDLDGFKGVNDELGHAGGDHLLTLVAERLRAVIRPSDTAARLGGDEFAVLVEDVIAEAEASYIAERILAALATPFAVHGTEVTVGASIGIALNTPGAELDDLLNNADAAMYAAKSEGKGRCVVFGTRPEATAGPAVTDDQAATTDLPHDTTIT